MTNAWPGAADILYDWIRNDYLASRVESWLDYLQYPDLDYLNKPRVTWYTLELTKNGPAAADAMLEQYAAKIRAIVTAIQNAANGMLALCKVDPKDRSGAKYVSVVDSRFLNLPGYHQNSSIAQAIVIFNPEVPGCGCSQPVGSHAFGRYGVLELKAVVLNVDPRSPEYSSLSLILPNRRNFASDADYTIVEFDLKGNHHLQVVSPCFHKDGPLEADLGLRPRKQAWTATFSSGGNADNVLGPGCLDYITGNLANLGTYFKATAEILSGAHTH